MKSARMPWIVLAGAVLLALAGCSKEEKGQPAAAPKEVERPTQLPATQAGAASAAGDQALSPQPAETDAVDAEHLAQAQRLINGGILYLLAARDPDGGWSAGGAIRPALTAMALKALVQHPDFGPEHPAVRKGFEILLSYRQTEGPAAAGIFNPSEGLANYTTAVAVMAMVAAGDPRYNAAIRDAVAFLKGEQIVPGAESPDGQTIAEGHPFVGGVSYGEGEHGRPDLSNVGMWMQALHDAGVAGDDPAIQRALAFVSRTQNRSESNPMAWAAEGGNDGGFVYAPAAGGSLTQGESKAGQAGTDGRGLRSYGSMTYVGFKSMLYANVARTDPRVRAAMDWIRRYWRLDSNPNMPQTQSREGLYYYYHVFAKAMRAWGEPIITDARSVKHNWREELIDELARRVRPDGSWVNDADANRWNEGSPVLVTCYSVLSLQEALKK